MSRAPICQQYVAQSPVEKGKYFRTDTRKGEIQAADKPVKLRATSLIIRETHIKTVTSPEVFIPTPEMENIDNASGSQGCRTTAMLARG